MTPRIAVEAIVVGGAWTLGVFLLAALAFRIVGVTCGS